MPFYTAVMYPNEPDIKFDEDYYISTHMPLVDQTWKPHGLTGWKVVKYTQAFDGTPSKYLIAAHLEWESEQSLQNALKDPESSKVFADIPQFTNKQPITVAGHAL